MSKSAALLFTALMASGLAGSGHNGGYDGFTDQLLDRQRRRREPKNRHNLNDEEIEVMSGMTPKEKKAWLKLSREDRMKIINFNRPLNSGDSK